jgi:hypothetical protein
LIQLSSDNSEAAEEWEIHAAERPTPTSTKLVCGISRDKLVTGRCEGRETGRGRSVIKRR